MSALTVDLGNSRCKLRLWNGLAVLAGVDLDVGETLVPAVLAWLDGRPAAVAGALCAVARREVEADLAAALRGRVPGFETRPAHGLRVACEEPETIGDDRLFAARGALEWLGRDCVVVDAGTALTVDALRVEGADGARVGTFVGGAIAPGPALLAAALASGGARLPAVRPRPDAPALGRRTRAALESGIAVGLRGAARELVAGVSEEAGLGPPGAVPVVVTGGAREFLTAGRPLAGEVRVEPDLVHLGLLASLPATRTA